MCLVKQQPGAIVKEEGRICFAVRRVPVGERVCSEFGVSRHDKHSKAHLPVGFGHLPRNIPDGA